MVIIAPPNKRPPPPSFSLGRSLLDRAIDNTLNTVASVSLHRVIATKTQPRGRVVWSPQSGPQTWLLSCPVQDVLFGGARGGGKSDALLGDWAAHAGRYGKYARGVLIRRTVPQLEEVMDRAQQLYPHLNAKWVAGKQLWIFPNGAILKMRWLERDRDADNYQGHQYSWIGIDEAGTWESPDGLDKLRACMRSAHGIPCFLRLTANPGGVGHEWLKARYVKAAPPLTPFYDAPKFTNRLYIPSRLSDNTALVQNDPTYINRIRSSGPDWLVKAWLDGDWDACAGDAFFTEASLLKNGQPVDMPANCDYVYCVIDTALKDGVQHDGTAVIYYARNTLADFDTTNTLTALTILDYEVLQIKGSLLDEWLPMINARCQELAMMTKARWGCSGLWIEDKGSGTILIQQGLKRNLPVFAIDGSLTAMGKEERATNVTGYVYGDGTRYENGYICGNQVKICEYAYNKVIEYKSSVCNHLISQVCGFRMGQKTGPRDLLDCFTYGIAIGLGNSNSN